MSPETQIRGGKILAGNNLYAAIVGIALFAVVATAALVTIKCYFQYGTIFNIP